MKRWAGWFGVALLLAGCSSGSVAEPRDGGRTPVEPSATLALPHSGAPAVPDPLPWSVLTGGPCAAVTPAQLKVILGETVPAMPGHLPIGPKCDWVRPQRSGQFAVAYATVDHQGLSAVYQNTRPGSTIWRPLPPIQGFPAVAHSSSEDLCDISVGLADDLSVDIVGVLGDTKAGKIDPCTVFPQAADLVVTTLRKKAGE